MTSVFVDTNVVIDLLSKRKDFYIEAQKLFTLADKKEVVIYISALTFANTHYILTKHLNKDVARKTLMRFKVLVHILPVDDKIIELALLSDFNDFEDAIQYYTALENDSKIIITRNKKDFKPAKLPIMNANEFLKFISSKSDSDKD